MMNAEQRSMHHQHGTGQAHFTGLHLERSAQRNQLHRQHLLLDPLNAMQIESHAGGSGCKVCGTRCFLCCSNWERSFLIKCSGIQQE